MVITDSWVNKSLLTEMWPHRISKLTGSPLTRDNPYNSVTPLANSQTRSKSLMHTNQSGKMNSVDPLVIILTYLLTSKRPRNTYPQQSIAPMVSTTKIRAQMRTKVSTISWVIRIGNKMLKASKIKWQWDQRCPQKSYRRSRNILPFREWLSRGRVSTEERQNGTNLSYKMDYNNR